ncbi:hypothetical protein FGADI_10139 [Fusarium gaditjirri]|uniref:N-acetyltransferase domain-containing protein n=1 Tax=Fusarium gaditjirri TaxID=282569 RepID=A0A8H4WRY4_9HYPO|nr:hypothetical protein FGADI_10139 [Fusarium gaditjirri]
MLVSCRPMTQSPAQTPSIVPLQRSPVPSGDNEQQAQGDNLSFDEDSQDFYGSDWDEEEVPTDDDCSGRSSRDEYAEFPWLEQIDTVATKDGTQIATCDAKLIRRNQISSAFWIQMEEPSHETSCLAFDMFDRYGRLSREFYEHSFKKGSGVWGSELDHGDILLLETISVTRQHRRVGLGTKIWEAILDKIRPTTHRFVAFVSPGYLTAEVDEGVPSEWKEHQAIAELFFRSLGFRRVGVSSWFAFVDNPNHPSRQLRASDDWDEPDYSYGTASIPESARQAFASLSDPKLPAGECASQLEKNMPGNFQDASWSAVDEYGNNLLHLAAIHAKLEAIRYILSCRPDLANNRNRAGNSPLEALKAKMELDRTRAVHGQLTSVRSDKFSGFSQSTIACLAALSDSELSDGRDQAYSEDTDRAVQSASPIRVHLRRVYWWFPQPEDAIALLRRAETQHELLQESFDEVRDGADWVEYNGKELCFLPASVKENLKTNKSMRQGFINICGYIANCLEQKKIPNESNVLSIYRRQGGEWPPVTKHYLERGGTVAAVATMVFDKALQRGGYLGEGDHQFLFGDEIVNSPECRNDYEFGFVSGMCGYRRISTVRYVDMFGNPIDKD